MELYIVLGDGIRPPTAAQTKREKRGLQSLEQRSGHFTFLVR